MQGLSQREAEALFYNWSFWARPEQVPPDGDWFVWLLLSGRGFGKTRTGSEWVHERVRQGFKRIALVGQTKADVRDTMVEVGESAILNVGSPRERPEYEPSKRRVTWPNGAVAIVYSGDEPDQLRGPQHDSAWVDELAKFKYPQETWDNLKFGLRIGARPQLVVTTTPRPIKLIRDLIANPTTMVVRRPSYDNINNLAPVYIREVIQPMEGTRLGRQEIHAEILDDAPGALWKRAQLEARRVNVAPELRRIVVGVDPTATSGGDEAGIVVAGVARVGDVDHGFVLDDGSRHGSPAEWGGAVVAAYHKSKADRVIAESNNGGEMVAHTIHSVEGGASVPVKLIHASRGKRTRAEPVSALYERGLVHHVGMFGALEDEMCQWEPDSDMDSPNRMDALVWAMTELMVEPAELRSRRMDWYEGRPAEVGGPVRSDEEVEKLLESF